MAAFLDRRRFDGLPPEQGMFALALLFLLFTLLRGDSPPESPSPDGAEPVGPVSPADQDFSGLALQAQQPASPERERTLFGSVSEADRLPPAELPVPTRRLRRPLGYPPVLAFLIDSPWQHPTRPDLRPRLAAAARAPKYERTARIAIGGGLARPVTVHAYNRETGRIDLTDAEGNRTLQFAQEKGGQAKIVRIDRSVADEFAHRTLAKPIVDLHYEKMIELARWAITNDLTDSATTLLGRASRSEPKQPEAYLFLAEIALAQGKVDDALQSLAQAKKKGAASGELAIARGLILARLGLWEEAAQAFATAKDDPASTARALAYQGEAYLKTGAIAEAKRLFDVAAVAPGGADLAINGRALAAALDRQAGRSTAPLLAKEDPLIHAADRLPEARINLAATYLLDGRPARAARLFKKGPAPNADTDPRRVTAQALAQVMEGRHGDALATLDTLAPTAPLMADPASGLCYEPLLRAMILVDENDRRRRDQAGPLLDQILRLPAVQPMERSVLGAANYLQAVRLEQRGAHQEAAIAFQKALPMAPSPTACFVGAAMNRWWHRIPSRAEPDHSAGPILRQAVDDGLGGAPMRQKLIELYLRIGRDAEAAEEAESLVADGPPAAAFYARQALALVAYRRGDRAKAERLLTALNTEADGADPEVIETLAMIDAYRHRTRRRYGFDGPDREAVEGVWQEWLERISTTAAGGHVWVQDKAVLLSIAGGPIDTEAAIGRPVDGEQFFALSAELSLIEGEAVAIGIAVAIVDSESGAVDRQIALFDQPDPDGNGRRIAYQYSEPNNPGEMHDLGPRPAGSTIRLRIEREDERYRFFVEGEELEYENPKELDRALPLHNPRRADDGGARGEMRVELRLFARSVGPGGWRVKVDNIEIVEEGQADG